MVSMIKEPNISKACEIFQSFIIRVYKDVKDLQIEVANEEDYDIITSFTDHGNSTSDTQCVSTRR